MTCIVCDSKGRVLYEDEHIKVVHERQASRGHVMVAPKQHITLIEDVPDHLMEHLFFSANLASAVLFELTAAHGTNILMSEGNCHVHIDIVERKQDDGMNFLWKPKKLTDQEMDAAAKRIKDALIIQKPKEEQEPVVTKEEPKEIIVDPEKVNWLVRQLDRIP